MVETADGDGVEVRPIVASVEGPVGPHRVLLELRGEPNEGRLGSEVADHEDVMLPTDPLVNRGEKLRGLLRRLLFPVPTSRPVSPADVKCHVLVAPGLSRNRDYVHSILEETVGQGGPCGGIENDCPCDVVGNNQAGRVDARAGDLVGIPVPA